MAAQTPTLEPLAVPRFEGSMLSALRAMQSDPLRFLRGLRDEHGPVVRFPLGRAVVFLVSDPDLAQRVLVTANHDFGKGFGRLGSKPGKQPLARLLGQGLLTSQGETHLRQRRLIQPVFHRERIASYGSVFSALSEQASDRWADGVPVDMHREMTELTYAIVMRTLFDTDADGRVADVVRTSLHATMRASRRARMPFAELLEKLPLPSTKQWHAARDRLWGVVDEMVAERQHDVDLADRPDLLSLLLAARDAETGAPMDARQVRDEALTIMLAGHETTANALSWAWHLLADHPDVVAKLQDEVDTVLGDRLPTAADFPALAYTDRVLTETMRIYPPAWMMVRRPVTPQQLGPYSIPAGGTIMLSPYVIHHDATLYPDPDAFDPDRWLPSQAAGRPRFAYLPFGAGPRKCIGDGFARMEGVLALATIARRWTVRRPAGAAPVRTLPLVTLRPRGGLPLVPVARG